MNKIKRIIASALGALVLISAMPVSAASKYKTEFQWITKPSLDYAQVSPLNKNWYYAKSLDGKLGVIDTSGNVVVPFEDCDEIVSYSNGFLGVKFKFENQTKLFNSNGEYLETFYYDIEAIYNGKIKYENDLTSGAGIINQDGEITVSFDIYKSIESIDGTYFIVRNSNYEYGVIDINGNIIIPLEYKSLEFVENERKKVIIAINTDRENGVIDLQGNIIIPFTEDYSIDNLGNLLKVTSINNDIAVYNLDGTEIIPFGKYNSLSGLFIYWGDGLVTGDIIAKKDNKFGVVDLAGNEIIPCVYEDLTSSVYIPGFILKKNGKFGLIDKNQNLILPCEYDSIEYFSGDCTSWRINGEYVVVYRNRNEEKLVKIKKDNYYGIADFNGNIILPCEYERIQNFYTSVPNPNADSIFESYAIVYKGDESSLIDLVTGKTIFDLDEYTTLESVSSDNFIKVLYDHKYDGTFCGIFDHSGKAVIPKEYFNITPVSYLAFILEKQNGKFELVDFENNKLVNGEFDKIINFGTTLAINSNGKWGFASVKPIIIESPAADTSSSTDTTSKQPADKTNNTNTATVTIPSFGITINSGKVSNTNALYPCITYKDITYFPMTYSGSRSLGLTADWTAENGLVIEKTGTAPCIPEFEQNSVPNSSGEKATIAAGKITVNGKTINNAEEEYPLLLFRDITYFPLTWRFAVDEFGWNYNFTSERGLEISCK